LSVDGRAKIIAISAKKFIKIFVQIIIIINIIIIIIARQHGNTYARY